MSWFKISSAVVVGNIVSWATIGVIGFFLSFVIMEATMEELFGGRPTLNAPSSSVPQPSTDFKGSLWDYSAEQATQEQHRLEERSRQETDERTDPSVVRTNRQMCEFWSSEFKNDGAEQSRKHRDAACSRYRASLN